MNTHIQTNFFTLSSTAFIMAAIAGFTDVIGFIGMDKLFTAHITGNIIIAIAEVINHEQGVMDKIIALIAFIVIVSIFGWIVDTFTIKMRGIAVIYVVEALLLLSFMWAGASLPPHMSEISWQYIGAGMFGVSAMAIHNSLGKVFFTHFPPFTVMTGNLTQIVIDIVSYCLRFKRQYSEEKIVKTKYLIKRYLNVFIGFLLGGCCAAVGYSWYGFWFVGVGAVLALILAISAWHARQVQQP